MSTKRNPYAKTLEGKHYRQQRVENDKRKKERYGIDYDVSEELEGGRIRLGDRHGRRPPGQGERGEAIRSVRSDMPNDTIERNDRQRTNQSRDALARDTARDLESLPHGRKGRRGTGGRVPEHRDSDGDEG